MHRDCPVQGAGHGTWPLDRVFTGHRKITACLASIPKGVYRQIRRFISAFIQRIETGCAEKCFLKGRTKAPTLTWNSESFFQAKRLSAFARQVTPFATYPAISWNTSVHR